MIPGEIVRERQQLPLEKKVELSKERIKEWYEAWEGQVYVSFSGGKDSTVLLDLVRSTYPEVPAVFVDTGLEYPEIREFVKTIDNVEWLKPKMPFHKVIEKYGYPVGSKKTARQIRDLQNPTEKNKATRNLYLHGIKRDGTKTKSFKLPKKWLKLIDSDIKVSEQCCNYIKKWPFEKYNKFSGKTPFIGTMASDSNQRFATYMKVGCNSFNGNPHSNPLAFWLEEDVWKYIKLKNLRYSQIYDKGETRTGCMFCMFGVHLEKQPNRFQRMKKTHPKQWKYCIEKLGVGKVLDFINVPYE